MARQFTLDPKAPTLLIGRLVPARRANWTVGTETHIVQQPERIPCGLNQPEFKRIAKVHERSCTVVWIHCEDICVLVKTCTAVGDDTGDPGARLPVVDAVPSAHDCVRNDLIGESEARLEVAPVGYVVGTLFRRGEYFSTVQGKVHGLTGNGVGIGHASTIQRIASIGIKPILVVEAVRARQGNVIPQAQVQCQFRGDFPVVLREESVLIVCGGRPGLNF